MPDSGLAKHLQVRILETPLEMQAVEELQRAVWPGNETEVVPGHVLVAAARNGGLVIGAYELQGAPGNELDRPSFAIEAPEAELLPGASLVGFVFGFPGLGKTGQGSRLKLYSHMLGVHPAARSQGIGFALKRAQWQMTRHKDIDWITWTYDPLLSRNAHLNLTRLGAVCSTYVREVYGAMRDQLNAGLSSDRFQVDWWLDTQRVHLRLSKRPRLQLDLAHFLAAGAQIINPTEIGRDGWPRPLQRENLHAEFAHNDRHNPLVLLEIPSNFQALRSADLGLALEWRLHSRHLFETLFEAGYLATDFIYLPGVYPRSFYVLSDGESTL